MNKQTNNKTSSITSFFGKPYMLVFACILFVAAAIKLAFTLSTKTATGTWKASLVTDTITTVLTASALFVFYVSGDGKSRSGLKTSSILFLVATSASIVTQFLILTHYATFDNIILLCLIFMAFSVQTLFQLFFALSLTKSSFKKRFITVGALPFAAVKATSVVMAVLIYSVKTSIINLELLKSPLIATNMLDTVYPQLAFFTFVATSLTLSTFALLYSKHALSAEENTEDTDNT